MVVTITIKDKIGVPIYSSNLTEYYVEVEQEYWYTTFEICFDSNAPYTIDLDWLGASLYLIRVYMA